MPCPRTLVALLLAASAADPAAAAPRIESSISSRFLVRGEQALFQVSVIGARPDSVPTPPTVPGLTFLRSEFAQPDARPLGREVSWDYTFQVFSYETGRHQVPALKVEAGGETLESPPLTFEVLSPDDLHWVTVAVGERQLRFAANFRATKDKPFDGETVPVELKLYAPGDLSVQDWGIPEFERNKLAVWRFEPNRLLGRATLNGRVHSSVSYPSTLTPTQSGKTTLGPAKLRLIVVETAMDAFGLRRVHEEVNLNVPALDLEARPLPPGAPEGFRNAVGQFTLRASADETEVREGDPVSVTLSVSGTGNLDSLLPPAPLAADGWKLYEAAGTQRGDERRSESGSVSFRQFMRPLTPQTKIPPFRLVFFDPEREHYRSLVTDPIPLTVLPSTRAPDPAAAAPPAAANLPVERMTDILGILPAADLLAARHRWPWWWLWQLLPAALALALLAQICRRHLLPRLRPEPLRSARRQALARLERSAPGDLRGFFRAAGGYVERWLGEQAAEQPELAAILRERDDTCFRPAEDNPPCDRRRRREVLRTLRRHALPLLVAAAAVVAAPRAGAAPGNPPADPAAAAYQDGRWSEAITRWMNDAPFDRLDPNRLHNIGNAWYRLGSPGQAALWWRRALARDPSHAEARQNLRFLERKFGSITVQRPAYQNALARLPLAAWQGLVWAAVWMTALGFLTFPATRPGARSRVAALIALVLAPVLAACGALAWRHYPDDASFCPLARQAVVTADRAVLYTDASRTSAEVIDAPPGSLCAVVADRGGWLYVSFATRTCGWIPAGQVEFLLPRRAPAPPDPSVKPKPAGGST